MMSQKNICLHRRLTPRRIIENSKGEGVSKAKIFKRKYETKVEFPEGWGWVCKPKNPLWEGYGYFLEQHYTLQHFAGDFDQTALSSLQFERKDLQMTPILETRPDHNTRNFVRFSL